MQHKRSHSRLLSILCRLTVALAVAGVALAGGIQGTAQAVTASPAQPKPVKGPTIQRGLSMHLSDQMGVSKTTVKRAGTVNASSTAPFMTRPYWNPHSVTSIFDHCNPNYTRDGAICEFDGTVATQANGADPTFSAGYAMTRGGSDYLYYDGHDGWDLALSYEPVLAAAPGVVFLAGYSSAGWGNQVIIDHPNGLSTKYAHLSQIFVQAGQSVGRGQQIGVSGNTGQSTGPHLHFGVYRNDPWTPIDPWGWTGAAADPWPSDLGNLWFSGNPQNPVPWAPTGVTAVATVGGASVSWTPPGFGGGDPITSYTIVSSPDAITTTVAGDQTSVAVTGLRPGVSYTFTVTAADDVGTGPASAPSNSVQPIAAENGTWESLGAPWTTRPAVAAWAKGRLDIFETGADQALWHRWWNGADWSAWESLGGSLASAPAVASWSANRLDVFAEGPDGTLRHTWWDGTQWNPWESLGGVLRAGPAVAAWGPGRLDVVVHGGDDQLWHRWWDGTGWSGWEPLGGVLAGDPAAVSWGTQRVDVVVRGTDNQLWHRWWDGRQWRGWEPVGGVLGDSPALASESAGQLDVFVVGPDRALYRKTWTGAWSSWKAWSGNWSSGPAAASQTAGNVDVFALGTDSAVWHTLITVP